MIEMSLAEIAAVVGGVVCGPPGSADVVVSAPAYLDSRAPEARGLFVAIVGERDGHAYAAPPHHPEPGAHAVLGSRPTGRPTVVVPDPVVALARLARHVVDRVAPTVVAVTGSQGKTSTKDLLAAVLPGAVATAGNLNNELGVPLTALRLRAGDRRLVLEMGARGVGHLSWLCEIAPPQVSVVLCVGTAHVAHFGSRDLIACAKGELVEVLPPDGVAVLNLDDPMVSAMAARTQARVLGFGVAGEISWRGVRLDELGRAGFELGHAGRWQPVHLAVAGAHQVANAAAAAAVALALGEPLDEVAQRLGAAGPASPGRLRPVARHDGLLVLDDTYNANPASVRAALETLVECGRHRPGRTVAVLGEMCELGASSTSAHRAVGALARELGVDAVLAVGPGAREIGCAADAHLVPDRPAALAWLHSHLRPDDVVLLKASRAAGLDRLAAGLLAPAAPVVTSVEV